MSKAATNTAIDATTNILVVDDHPDNLRTLSAILKSEGYKVRQALNGQLALETAYSQPPDLVLLDIRMPNVDGYEVCMALKQDARTHDIPVIFLSAMNNVDDKIKAFEVGGVDYITKPFRAKEVMARIENQLTLQQQRRQLSQQNQQLQQQLQERRLLSQVVHQIRRSLGLNDILNATVEEVQQLFQIDQVMVIRFLADWQGAVVAESVHPPTRSWLGSTIHHPAFQAFWSQNAQPLVMVMGDRSTRDLPSTYLAFLASLQIQAELAAPIVQDDVLWGLLVAHQWVALRDWKSWEIDFFEQLAEQLAVATQQAELYHQVQDLNLNLEQQIQVRILELQQTSDFEASLKLITDQVRNTLDERLILQTAVTELVNVLQINRCETLLYRDEQSPLLICQHQAPINAAEGKGSNGADTNIADTTIADLHDQLQSGVAVSFCSINPTCPTQSAILVCPIQDENQVMIGLLRLFKSVVSGFSELEIRLVKQVANQCAIAIRQTRLYQAAQAQVRELEKLNRLKDDFLSTISYELRAPVANIKVVSDLLMLITDSQTDIFNQLVNSQQGEHKLRQYVRVLREECDRELHLIQNLLDLQHLEAGNYVLRPSTINLMDWMFDLVEPFVARIQAQRQILHVTLPPDIPPFETDPCCLNRVLSELLNNACKYTPSGGIITVSAEVKDQRLLIRVSNSGSTIPAEELPKIFDKFYRVPSNDPWKHGGTGLGLALVRQLVKHIGGCVDTTSQEDITCFTVSLPL